MSIAAGTLRAGHSANLGLFMGCLVIMDLWFSGDLWFSDCLLWFWLALGLSLTFQAIRCLLVDRRIAATFERLRWTAQSTYSSASIPHQSLNSPSHGFGL